MATHKMGNLKITINYGYDIHSLILSADDFDKIKKGDAVEIDGQGFSIEGEISQDNWAFKNGTIKVICENSFEVFEGSINDIIGIETI